MVAQTRLVWANSSRGLAAAAVMLGHLLVALVLLQPWVEESIGISVGRPLTDYGQGALTATTGFDVMAAGVCLFFLISGLVIARSLERYTRMGFLVGRLLRLLPTYAAGYATVVLVLVVAGAVLGLGRVVSWSDTVGLIPGLPVLLQVATVPNTVAWTLVVEFVFYGVCLVLHRRLLAGPGILLALAVGCLVGQAGLLAVTPPPILSGAADLLLVALPFLPVLLIGVLLSGARRWAQLWPVVPLVLAFLWMTQFRVWWPFSPLGLAGADLGYRLTFIVTIVAFLLLWHASPGRFDGPVLRWLADISYPLYVIHAMLGWIVIVLLVRAGLTEWIAMALGVGAVLLVAWVLHVTVEAPTHRWARDLARRVSVPQAQVSSDA